MLTEKQINFIQEEKGKKIKGALLNLHGGFVEGGQPHHVITPDEAVQAVGCTKSELYHWLHDAYAETSLNNVLKILGLPYRNQPEKNFGSFTRISIVEWFEQFYTKNGNAPNQKDVSDASKRQELPDDKTFKKIMGESSNSFRKSFVAKKDLGIS